MVVLIADDNEELAESIGLFVEDCGHQSIIVTTGGLEVIQCFQRFKPDVILMDIMMPRLNGITIAHSILSRDPKANLVLISGEISAGHPFITTSGVTRFLQKPVQLEALKALLDQFARRKAA